MDRYFEPIRSELGHGITTLLDAMSSFVCIQYIVKHSLATHLYPRDTELSSVLAIVISDVLWSRFEGESDYPTSSGFVDGNRFRYVLGE